MQDHSFLCRPCGGFLFLRCCFIAGKSRWLSIFFAKNTSLSRLHVMTTTEKAYHLFHSVLQVKIHAVATKRYEKPVLRPVSRWIEVIFRDARFTVPLSSWIASIRDYVVFCPCLNTDDFDNAGCSSSLPFCYPCLLWFWY